MKNKKQGWKLWVIYALFVGFAVGAVVEFIAMSPHVTIIDQCDYNIYNIDGTSCEGVWICVPNGYYNYIPPAEESIFWNYTKPEFYDGNWGTYTIRNESEDYQALLAVVD